MLIHPKRLRKIKPDGLFKGKNRQLLDADGLVITDSIKAIKETIMFKDESEKLD